MIRARILIVVIFTFTITKIFAQESSWKQIALKDLMAIKNTIEEDHPGAQDKENPFFNHWFNEGLKKSELLAKDATSFDEYYFLLRQFINGFFDGHLFLQFKNSSINLKTSRIVIVYKEGKFVVHSKLWNDSQSLPNTNDILLSCDGNTPESIMLKNVFPYYGNKFLPGDWIHHAPKLLIDFNNPYIKLPKKCKFKFFGEWRPVWEIPPSLSQLPSIINNKVSMISRPDFEFRKLATNFHWISLPSFYIENDDLDKIYNILKEIKNIKSKTSVIFDLRGNTGGNSYWGDLFYETIYGSANLVKIKKMINEKQYVEYRASEGNIKHFENAIAGMTKQFGEKSPSVKYFNTVVEGMKESKQKNRAFFLDKNNTKNQEINQINEIKKNNFIFKVFLLTDRYCASACLDFIDQFIQGKNVIHVGQATSGDTNYMDIRSVMLPSNKAQLYFPTKVYRNRPRGANIFYNPKHIWDKDISDTKEIEEWIQKIF